MHTTEMMIDLFFDGFDDLFGDFGMVTFDALGAAVIAIGVSWKKIDFNTADDDLEELDNELEDINTNNMTSNTAMDDVLNQDVPTLDIDQNWDCTKCGATNRSIVDTCEYCGENK